MKFIAKGCQTGAQIDAKTHKKSMPKLVTKTTMNIIKSHVSLNGKNIEIIVKITTFEGLTGCVHERNTYQQHINNDTNIHSKIDDKSMQNVFSKKVMQQI